MQFINNIKKFCKKINYVPSNKLKVLTKNKNFKNNKKFKNDKIFKKIKNKHCFPSFNALPIETRRELYSFVNNIK